MSLRTKSLTAFAVFFSVAPIMCTAESPAVSAEPFPVWQKTLCDPREIKTTSKLPPDTTPLKLIDSIAEIEPSPANIFLVESACNPRPLFRAWCAVESWALQNPQGRVHYVMTSPYIEDILGMVKTLTSTYENLKITAVDLDNLFKNTPLKEFFSSLRWANNTEWPMIQLSDMMRIVLVWKFGGYYSDSDIICIKNVFQLKNVAGFQDASIVNNAHFHAYPNHMFLEKLLKDVVDHFNPREWGSLGPTLFSRAMIEKCGSPLKSKDKKDPPQCFNMTLLPPEAFSPVFWGDFRSMVNPGGWKHMEKKLEKSYSIHFFNKFMQFEAIEVGGNSIYEAAAKKFCPVTYGFAGTHSRFF